MKGLLATSILPSLGVLGAFIAILIGQHIEEKYKPKESHLFLIVISLSITFGLILCGIALALIGSLE